MRIDMPEPEKIDRTSSALVPAEEDSNDGGVLAIIRQWVTKWASGIPTVFQKPLAKAANRLILGLVEVPAAALAAKAKDISR